MSSSYGNNLKVQVFGQSHSPAIGVVIDGFPSGMKVDMEFLSSFMVRRAPGQNLSTPRKEADDVEFLSGLNENGETCGAPICAIIKNTNVRSKDYSNLAITPRPSHSDYTSLIKYGESRDIRGGGQFSGRLTAPLCIAGALCLQYLKTNGVKIGAHISSVLNVLDDAYDLVSDEIPDNVSDFSCINEEKASQMKAVIESARMACDSVGGTIECKITGVREGIGDPMFDGVENRLAQIMFGIPAVKGFEVGAGFDVAKRYGSENNDPLCVVDGKVKTVTNNAGGINGGITNSMPIVFKVAFKPTPSIAKSQQSVNLSEMKEATLEIKGRHDPCIVVRAVPVVEACAAIAILDMML
ncbi:MAG: chorismate synthase [Clostridiales bacterium]|nr:chorismate synthase [Clostridiales bacterium]